MPGQDFSRPLIGAGAGVSNEFAHAEANAGIDFLASAELKRGFKTEIGITAFTNAGAGISKFVSANIEGTAFASARAGIQGQLALNFFKEFGFIVKAEAVAEAAAGVKASLGINVGDFINLALKDKSNLGLPMELLLLLLEEVEIGGSFYIDISASAKAHCTISLSGTLLPKTGQKAGFRFTTKAGAGLAKGVGMAFQAGIGFKDFRRFYGRAVDKTVDEVLSQVIMHLPPQAKPITPFINAFGPIAKMSLRMSYDIGEKIIKNNIGKTPDEAQALCNECIKIILEEVQRFSIEKLTEYSLREIKEAMLSTVKNSGNDIWDKTSGERRELADVLTKFPEEPFQPIAENIQYWKDLILKIINLAEKLFPGMNVDEDMTEKITLLYCAAELSIEAIRVKINTATAYVVIPTGTQSVHSEPFINPLSVQPPLFIQNAIRTKTGMTSGADISYADILKYLTDDLIIDGVLAKIPELKTFVGIFKEDFNEAEKEILKLLLSSAGAFIQKNNGAVFPKDSLKILVKSIDRFLTKKFRTEVLTEINKHISDPVLKMYMDEVLLSCVIYTKDVALNTALNWETAPYTNDDFTEALAGVMMMFLGRSIVLMSDTLLTATQNEVQAICNDIAGKIETNHKDIKPLKPLLKDENLKQLFAETLRVGGEVLGPLPDDSRRRVRMLLYQVFEVIKPGQEQEFLEELQNQLFIPNVADIQALCRELAEIAKYRFGLFAEKILLNIGRYILESLEDLFQHLLHLILDWEKNLAASLLLIAGELNTIDQKIIAINTAITAQYRLMRNAYTAFVTKINSTQIRNAIKTTLTDRFFSVAEVLLKEQNAYRLLPRNVKASAESTLRTAINTLLNTPVLNPVYDSIDAIGNELDDLMPDAKRLDVNRNLSEQFLDLVLDKIEEKIRQHFGSTKPGITVAVNFSYTVPEVIITPAVHVPPKVITPAIDVPATPFSPAYTIPAVMSPAIDIPAVITPAQTIRVNIPLGKVEVNLNPFINLVRDAINTSDFYHDKLNNFVIKLGAVMAKELEKKAEELKRSGLQGRQHNIRKIAGELSDKTPEINILKPLSLSTHVSDIPVDIQLKEVPPSFLGMQTDEIQRVHIFLNGQSVLFSSLSADARVYSEQQGVQIMRIKYSLLKKELTEGVNTITVSVIGKGGNRQQQQVHFIYNPESKQLNDIIPVKNTKQLLLRKIADAKKYASDRSSFTFKNIRP